MKRVPFYKKWVAGVAPRYIADRAPPHTGKGLTAYCIAQDTPDTHPDDPPDPETARYIKWLNTATAANFCHTFLNPKPQRMQDKTTTPPAVIRLDQPTADLLTKVANAANLSRNRVGELIIQSALGMPTTVDYSALIAQAIKAAKP